MERWLSKSRVLLGLSGVLLVAALNRQDPMVYGMFLFVAVVSFLGFALPWLSLRSMTVGVASSGELETIENLGCDLRVAVERRLPWPAFMVDVETEWECASRRIVLRQTLAVVRTGNSPVLQRSIHFPCRGRYELIAVRLSSGFPLGLIRAQHAISCPPVVVLVLPQAQALKWPLPWDIAEDPLGELTTRRIGQSFELGMLRPYKHGEAMGRVSWRASARVGELVIQHFQQSGSVRLGILLDAPGGPEFGDADGAGEQVLRVAAGVCDEAFSVDARVWIDLGQGSTRVRDAATARRALAQLGPKNGTALEALARAGRQSTPGEQLAILVTPACPVQQLCDGLRQYVARGVQVVVVVVLGRRRVAKDILLAQALKDAVTNAGYVVCMEAP